MYLFLNRYIPRSIFYISASLQCLGSFENKYIPDLDFILPYASVYIIIFYENINRELNHSLAPTKMEKKESTTDNNTYMYYMLII